MFITPPPNQTMFINQPTYINPSLPMVFVNRQNQIKKHEETKERSIPWNKYIAAAYLIFFQCAFIVLIGIFGSYEYINGTDEVPTLYAMWMDVHSMMFVGFGFLMTFLKKYGYSAVGFNFMLAAYVIQWALIVNGWFDGGRGNYGKFHIQLLDLLNADFMAATILISFGAIIGRANPLQLLIMGTFEVVASAVNDYICGHVLEIYDVGDSIFVHMFGAYFGLAVSKVLYHKEPHNENEGESYLSNLFSMIGTIFLWLYWPSFNAATAAGEGQNRAIINTYLSIAASVITSFAVSTIIEKGKLKMMHIQNATLAGGVAIGAIADMNIQPYAAMLIGAITGIITTLGFQYLTPFLKNKLHLNDVCGVHNLHGMPGFFSGIISAIVASTATRSAYRGNDLYIYYPSRIPKINSTDYFNYGLDNSPLYSMGGLGRSGSEQAGYQLAGMAVTLGIAIVSGVITGLIMRFFGFIDNEAEQFYDEENWETPEDFLKNE